MTRALAAADRTRPAPGDLPDFDEEARDRRLVMTRFLGVDPRFCDVVDRVAPSADLGEIVPAVFAAHAAAQRGMSAVMSYRARAAAVAARRRKALALAIELLRPVDDDRDDALADEVINEIVGALRGIAAPALGLDRPRLIAALIAERERYDQALRQLDGRGSPPSRLRLFADHLAPIFARAAASDRKTRSDFRDFLAAAANLVVGVEPDRALANSVARALFK